MNTHSASSPAAPAPARYFALEHWLRQHLHDAGASFFSILRRPWSNALTIMAMALTLMLPLGLAIVLSNIQQLASSVQSTRVIDLFLQPELELSAARALAATLNDREDVAEVVLRTPDEGLDILRQYTELGAAVDALGENPLPILLIITPQGDDDSALAQALATLPQADVVQYDAQWRQRLLAWLTLGKRLVHLFTVLFGLGALVVVGNTVRLELQTRREEIDVLHLLGAHDGFIRRPFVWLGVWYGLAAGVFALAWIAVCGGLLRPSLAVLADSYGSDFVLHGPTSTICGFILVGTVLVGWLGAWLAASHFLRQVRPLDK